MNFIGWCRLANVFVLGKIMEAGCLSIFHHEQTDLSLLGYFGYTIANKLIMKNISMKFSNGSIRALTSV